MRLTLLTAFALALAFTLPDRAKGQTPTELFLIRFPDGFKLGYTRAAMSEWVPAGESVDGWSEMITVQIFHVSPGLSQETFLQKLDEGWMKACPQTPKRSIVTGSTNGYAVSMQLLSCPLNATTGKPETTAFRIIRGASDLFLVQRAFRSVPTPEQLAAAMQFLGTVSLCDTHMPGHPCPESMPAASPPAAHP
jgi:hypothetical protein